MLAWTVYLSFASALVLMLLPKGRVDLARGVAVLIAAVSTRRIEHMVGLCRSVLYAAFKVLLLRQLVTAALPRARLGATSCNRRPSPRLLFPLLVPLTFTHPFHTPLHTPLAN